MKKILTVMGILLLALLCAADCGEQEDESRAEEYARASLFCDVSFWEPPVWDETPGTIMGDISARTGLALDITVPAQDADTQLKIRLVNDELPDIISVTDSLAVSQLVDSGKVWRLDEFLQEYKPDSHLLEYFPEDIKAELEKRDGGWYALPSHINSADAREHWKATPRYEELVSYNDNNAIIWNRALLAEAGLDAGNLQTQQEVLGAFEKVKELHLQVNGEPVIILQVDGKEYRDPTLKYLEGTFGAEWVDDEGNYRDILLQPQTRNAFAFLNGAVRSGYVTPGQFTMETTEVAALMQSGRVLCFIGNIANTGVDFADWVSSGVILSSDGCSPVMGKNVRASTGWISTFVSKDCVNPEAIAAFLDYMTSDEGLAFWHFGYEGVDYHVNDEGLYALVPELEGVDAEEARRIKGMGIWWMFSNTAWYRSVEAEAEGSGADEAEAMTAYGKHESTVMYDASLLMMPVNLISTESEEAKIEKAIEEWKDTQIIKVILAEDEESFSQEYDVFIKGLYERGIEQLDARKNEGYRQNCAEYGSSIAKVNPNTAGDTGVGEGGGGSPEGAGTGAYPAEGDAESGPEQGAEAGTGQRAE